MSILNQSLRYRLSTIDHHQADFGDYISDIKTEIQAILNEVCMRFPWEQSLFQLNQSLLSYGITEDLKWASHDRYQNPAALAQLAKIISNHEPRLKRCHLSLLEHSGNPSKIHLIIEGEVRYANQDKSLQLEAFCQPIQRRFTIS
jgi:predicted component of type VI protein secretion system